MVEKFLLPGNLFAIDIIDGTTAFCAFQYAFQLNNSVCILHPIWTLKRKAVFCKRNGCHKILFRCSVGNQYQGITCKRTGPVYQQIIGQGKRNIFFLLPDRHLKIFNIQTIGPGVILSILFFVAGDKTSR